MNLHARAAFVIAVHRVAPELWPSLAGLGASRPRWAVRAWMRRHGLAIPGLEWLVDDLVGDGPPPPEMAHDPAAWVPAIASLEDSEPPTLSFAWAPAETGEDRAAFLKRGAGLLAAYADHVEAKARAAGVTTRPRARGVMPGAQRWEILARRIVLHETYATIAARLGRRRSDGSGGIEPAAARRHAIALAKSLGIPASALET